MAETSDVSTSFEQTTDAALWAKAFCDLFIVSTAEGVVQDAEGLMIGWFANAIERGRTAGQSEEIDPEEGYLSPDERLKRFGTL